MSERKRGIEWHRIAVNAAISGALLLWLGSVRTHGFYNPPALRYHAAVGPTSHDKCSPQTTLNFRCSVQLAGRQQKSASVSRSGSKNSAGRRQQKNSTKNAKRSKSAAPGKGTASNEPAFTISNQNSHAPPWKVLSKKDAKKNVESEKRRRAGLDENTDEKSDLTLSKAFLSGPDAAMLGWKRFNPSTSIASMRYVTSTLKKKLPDRIGVPEIAFLGRSNVGKSSLLNKLSSIGNTKHKEEARVGKTPGATASVNLYALLDRKDKPILGFVDLPGFGYAKLSKSVQEAVQEAAERYLDKREELVLGILLVDIRRIPSDDDRGLLAALYDMNLPVVVIATKMDKLSNSMVDQQLEEIRDGLGLPEGQPLCVSSVTGEGTKALWSIIMDACEDGIVEFRKKKLSGMDSKEEEDEEEDSQFDDGEELVYSQGYDWIQDSAVMYEGNHDDYVVEEEDLDGADEEEILGGDLNRESLTDLKRRARRLERDGEL